MSGNTNFGIISVISLGIPTLSYMFNVCQGSSERDGLPENDILAYLTVLLQLHPLFFYFTDEIRNVDTAKGLETAFESSIQTALSTYGNVQKNQEK